MFENNLESVTINTCVDAFAEIAVKKRFQLQRDNQSWSYKHTRALHQAEPHMERRKQLEIQVQLIPSQRPGADHWQLQMKKKIWMKPLRAKEMVISFKVEWCPGMLSARQFKVVGGRGPRRVPVKLPRTQNASVKRDLKQQKEALDKTISLTNVKHRMGGISVCVCVCVCTGNKKQMFKTKPGAQPHATYAQQQTKWWCAPNVRERHVRKNITKQRSWICAHRQREVAGTKHEHAHDKWQNRQAHTQPAHLLLARTSSR